MVKIYEGDRAEDIIANLRRQQRIKLSNEQFKKIEEVVKVHTLL